MTTTKKHVFEMLDDAIAPDGQASIWNYYDEDGRQIGGDPPLGYQALARLINWAFEKGQTEGDTLGLIEAELLENAARLEACADRLRSYEVRTQQRLDAIKR